MEMHGAGGFLGSYPWDFGHMLLWIRGYNDFFLWNAGFFLKELAAVVISSIYAFVISYLMLWLVNKITPVKVTKQDEENGRDAALHGESTYEMIWFLLSSEFNITPRLN